MNDWHAQHMPRARLCPTDASLIKRSENTEHLSLREDLVNNRITDISYVHARNSNPMRALFASAT
jgi:hypothetical protein